jgi:UDP-3-O-[3-hydroxymyristoyl] N-acetylglucosamine deacetylase
LGLDGVTVATTEHLLAALLGSGIDNAMVDLDAPEVPIFDGSAAPYVDLIKSAGIEEQRGERYVLKVSRTLEVRDGDAFVRVSPADQLQITYTIDYPHPLLGRQTSKWRFSNSSFEAEIAGARTFGFLKDLDYLQAKGLARGGSLANAIVFDKDHVLNDDGFRFSDECVRHKILDLVGDLALVGRPVLAHVEAYKAGHTLHNRLVRHLLTSPGGYQISAVNLPSPPVFSIPPASPGLQPILIAF